MSRFILPNVFIPGTKAKAQEVNENFSSIQEELNNKADKCGDYTQKFAVANATQDYHAITKSQAENLVENLSSEIEQFFNKEKETFLIKSGYTNADGESEVMSYQNGMLTFNIDDGDIYGQLVCVPANSKEKFTITELNPIDMSSYTNGTYNVFVSSDSNNVHILNNKLYIQCKRPSSPEFESVFVDISKGDATAQKYNGYEWIEFNDVFLGQVTVLDGEITNILNTPINFNGKGRILVDSYNSSNSYYKIFLEYSNSENKFKKWCEQGFLFENLRNGTNCTLLVAYKDLNYFGNVQCQSSISAEYVGNTSFLPQTTSVVYINSGFTNGSKCLFIAKGYIY